MRLEGRALAWFRAALETSGNSNLVRIDGLQIFPGANPYSLEPVLAAHLSTQARDISFETIEARLGQLLPGRRRTDDAPSSDPGFGGKCAGRIIGKTAAHLLSHFLGYAVRGGGSKSEGTKELCWIEVFAGAPGLEALATAAHILIQVTTDPSLPRLSEERLRALQNLCDQRSLTRSSQVLIRAARKRNIPFLQIGSSRSHWQFGWGRRALTFFYTSSNKDGMVGYKVARDKALAKTLFGNLGVPTPGWRLLAPDQDHEPIGRVIGFPCAVKPLDQSSGKGVSANVRTMEDLARAVQLARSCSSHILIEEHVPGVDYRLLVVDGKLVAAVRRDPPSVVGDGKASVGELIEALNRSRQLSCGRSNGLKPLEKDRQLAAHLLSQNMTMASILAKGSRLALRSNANYSTGGSATDVLGQVHPHVRRQAELLALASGIRAAGIDYISPDISGSQEEVGGCYIEINTTPDMFVHLAAGMSEEQIGSLFLGTHPKRIPVRLLLANRETSPALAEVLRSRIGGSDNFAVSAANWAQVGPLPLSVGRAQPLAVASMPLRYPVDALAVLWTVEDMQRIGLPLDQYERIVIFGAKPREPWRSVLHKLSEEVRVERAIGPAIEAVFEQFGG